MYSAATLPAKVHVTPTQSTQPGIITSTPTFSSFVVSLSFGLVQLGGSKNGYETSGKLKQCEDAGKHQEGNQAKSANLLGRW